MTSDPLRREYARSILSESDAAADPILQFRLWFDDALAAEVVEPNAMTLATATPDGWPSARIVLLKAFDERGFAFHTHYQSRKGRELDANPRAALVLFWPEFERQVRVEGPVKRLSDAESDAYFQGRPLGSRLGAWASPQSEVVPDRHAFEARVEEIRRQHPDGAIPRPPYWGGYRVVPDCVEFWQGRPNRLHDRLRYRKSADGSWLIERLSP